MTTINDVTFNLQNFRIISRHRNVVSAQPGSDENYITDMGHDGLVLRLEGYETSLATYDNVITEFMKTGGNTLVHRSGWQYIVYSTELNPILLEGVPDNYFPYELTLITSTPYRESTTLDCRAKEITTNNQEWSVEDIPCGNLLKNWNFEDWTAGTSSAPDNWVQSSGTISKETTVVKYGSASAEITPSYANLYQEISYPTNYRGNVLTFGCWVYTTTGNNSYLRIQDSDGYSDSTFHNTPSTWRWLTVSRTIASDTTFIRVHCSMKGSNTITRYDAAVLVEGASIQDNTFVRDIDTDGNVDAVPDIRVIGGTPASSINRTYGLTDGDTDATEYTTSSTSYILRKTFTFTALPGIAYMLDYIAAQLKIDIGTDLAYVKATIETASLYSGVETDLCEFTQAAGYATKSCSPDLTAGINEEVIIRWYQKSAQNYRTAYLKDIDVDLVYYRKDICLEPEIYNILYTTIKCDVGNEILEDVEYRINTDGTGTIKYSDDFTTAKYRDAFYDISGVTYDDANNELDFGNDEYIIYKIDTKYPITGIPTLTATIDVDSGTPTIEISSDGTTFYPIDTPIVDNVSTVYLLNNTSNLSLKGLTTLYIKLDCDGSSTCSFTNFSLLVNIITIDVEHPKIGVTGVSTFRCDQGADSGLACNISLIYRHRSWPV